MDAQPCSLCNSLIYATYIYIYIILYTFINIKRGPIYIYEAPNLIYLLSITCYFVNMLSFFSAEFTLPYLHSFRTYPAKVPPTTVLMPAKWNSSDTPVVHYHINIINIIIIMLNIDRSN